MRLTGAAGATLQARPTYQQTGTQPNGTSTASCVSLYMYDGNPGGYYTVGDPGNTYWYRIACPSRSDARRVGQEGVSPCRCRWSPEHENKKIQIKQYDYL